MTPNRDADLTRILAEPDPVGRMRELFPLVYGDLRRLADIRFNKERAGHTLQPTALVHEAFMRLASSTGGWESRRHFYGAAAETMRRILIDHARQAGTARRGAEWLRVTLTGTPLEPVSSRPEDLVELDDALAELAQLDARAGEVARLRFFAGLEVEEVARALEVSKSTVMRDWKYARARLAQLLGVSAGAA